MRSHLHYPKLTHVASYWCGKGTYITEPRSTASTGMNGCGSRRASIRITSSSTNSVYASHLLLEYGLTVGTITCKFSRRLRSRPTWLGKSLTFGAVHEGADKMIYRCRVIGITWRALPPIDLWALSIQPSRTSSFVLLHGRTNRQCVRSHDTVERIRCSVARSCTAKSKRPLRVASRH